MFKRLSIFISVLPLVIIIYYITKFIFDYFKKFNYNFLLNELIYVFGIIFVTLSIQVIKRIPWSQSYYKYTMRPEGACDCDYLSLKGVVKENTPGFPSGHMGTVSYFAINNILYYLDKYNNNDISKNNIYLYVISNILFILSTGWARIYKKCHNLLQVICGTLYGLIIGVIFYFIKFDY
jgi:membrane-associated phospholipid phosphatase